MEWIVALMEDYQVTLRKLAVRDDRYIEALLQARERPEFVSAVRALDRVLISAQFSVPLFYTPGQWVARWRKVAHPAKVSLSGTLAESWWQGT